MEIIVKHKTVRFNLLMSLYIASEADYDYAINMKLLGEQMNLDESKFQRALKYLLEENFIENRDGGNEFLCAITHKGVKVVEEVFLDAKKQTYYFPPYRQMRSVEG